MAAEHPGKGGNAETLRRYWSTGPGASKIRWGTPGDFDRCVTEVDQFMPGRAKGYCNLLHHRALGYYPATHAKMDRGLAAPTLWETAVPHDSADLVAQLRKLALAGTFNSALHPHAPAGSTTGGQFAPARNSKAAEAQKDPKAGEAYKKTLGAGDAKAQLAGMTNDDLIALSKAAYSFKSSDPKVVALRIQLANEIAKRGGNVNDYGGLGKPTPGGPKPLKPPAAAAPKKAAAAKAPKAPPAKSATGAKQVGAYEDGSAKYADGTSYDPDTGKYKKTDTTKGDAAAAAARAKLAASHVRLAFPATTSGDGPGVVTNGNLKTPGHIQAAVKAHGKVPPALQAGYRKRVIGAAKKMGALRHVPLAWLHGKEA